ncbi:hypothetical protein SFRURICE_002034 [Spodoptera frugiperda]|nr:hypothetical protein SFRURICE_002034 [Spodoptera frugiperda]
MDAVSIKKRRTPLSSRREKRWSMNSQRLDEIVAQLMQPVSMKNQEQIFNHNITELLEEYMTEAGLRALEGGEDVRVNFPEMAILLQRTVDIYSHKVDCLHQSILDYCDKLLTARQVKPFSFAVRRRSFAASMLRYATRVRVVLREEEEEEEEAQGQAAAETAARRARRRASAELDFAHIALSAAAPREPAAARPPPTLPRMYVELEPRRITAADVELQDYAGEHIGLLSDYQVTCRLHRGMLVDELEDGSSQARPLRPISLLELQEAIAAAAPPPLAASTPERDSPPRTPDPPRHRRTSDLDATLQSPDLAADIRGPHLATPDMAAVAHAPELAAPLDTPDAARLDDTCRTPAADRTTPKHNKKERKRRSETSIDTAIKISVGEDLRQKLDEVQEFSIPATWIRKIFPGWSPEEGARAVAAAAKHASKLLDSDDDDGFFEQSSVADSDASRAEEPRLADLAPAALHGLAPPEGAGDGWQQTHRALAPQTSQSRALGAGADAAGGRGPAVRVGRERLRRGVAAPTSHVLLATLFLANSRNVEVLAGPALSVAEFSLRLLSMDERRYSEAAAQEPFMR